MRKIIIVFSFFLSVCAFSAFADNDRAVQYEKLPAKARMFISENFPDSKPAYSKQERDFLETHYEVVLVAGVKLVFDRFGNWTDIECRYSELEEKFIPEQARKKISDLFPGVSYKKIAKERGNYEIELSNGIELRFDKNYSLLEIDD